jgi:DNA-binding response OmpR family regulator
MARTKVAVACRSRAERAAITEWLEQGGFHPLPIFDTAVPPRDLEALAFELLIIDAELMNAGSLMHVARYRATPRPVIVVGDADPDAEIDAERRGASYLVRPLDRQGLVFAVTLALAEGRPMRRSARKAISRVPGAVDGVNTRVLDVSYEGVRVELLARDRATLPPFFTLRVPLFDVAVLVQRVWVCSGTGEGTLWCGGALARNPQRNVVSWRSLVDHAPATSSGELRHIT